MRDYKQIPSEKNLRIYPNTKLRLIRTVKDKINFLLSHELDQIAALMTRGLKWLGTIPDTFLNRKCGVEEFLQLGVIREVDKEIYAILICATDDKEVIQQKRVLLASDYFEDADDRTKIYKSND